MPHRAFPGRLLVLSAASSLFVLVASGVVAISLYLDQSHTAELLSEDIGSRGAAINIDTTLDRLVALHSRGSANVGPTHEQFRHDLTEIERFADKPTEQELARRVSASFEEYLKRWRAGTPPAELGEYLRTDTRAAVDELRAFNGRELTASEETHRRSVRRMAWGLTIVGGLGSVAGLVFGYGLARSLRRTIRRFLVQVRGAAELLGQQLPVVELVQDDPNSPDGAEELLRRVEQVVSRLNEQERETRRAERMAAVGRLAAGVAHEVRNPLTAAILLLETARKDPTAGGLTGEDLDLIESELHRIERTLQSFLTFARPPKFDPGVHDLRDVVREALALSRGRLEQAGIAVEQQLPDDPCRLTCDPGQMKQVLLNLILNSADAMPTGGRLTISLTPAESGVELSVADSGTGIPPDILPRLFESFVSSKETGTGLGLVVCRRIVEEHGGTLTGENPPGGGARFTLRLPKRKPGEVVRTDK